MTPSCAQMTTILIGMVRSTPLSFRGTAVYPKTEIFLLSLFCAAGLTGGGNAAFFRPEHMVCVSMLFKRHKTSKYVCIVNVLFFCLCCSLL